MKKNYGTPISPRLTAYTSMAVAFLAGGNSVVGEIIYRDIDDTTVEVGDYFELDMDNDGISDFLIRASSITGPNGLWTFVSIFGSYNYMTLGGPLNQVMAYLGPYSYYYGSFLDAGHPIGPDETWIASANSLICIASNYYGVTYGEFPGQGDGYLGVRFSIGGNVHYGWIRVKADVDPVYATIKDLAYESTPETEIEAGAPNIAIETEIPEGLLQVYSYDNIIQINNKGVETADISVYDLTGQLLVSQPLKMGQNLVVLNNAPTGNYFLKISSKEGDFAKQLYIN